MTHSMTRSRLATAVVVGALATSILSSCGGGSSKKTNASATGATSTTVAHAATTTTAAAAASGDVTADTAKAKLINLQQADFPQGWTSTPATQKSAQDQADDVKTATCLGVSPPQQAHTADVNSDDFHNGQLAVSSNVTFSRTTEIARQELAAYKSSKVTSCLTQSLQDAMSQDAQGATISNIALTPTTPPPGGDGGFGYHVTATVSAGGQQVQLAVDILVVVVGRAEVQIASFAAGGPGVPDATLRSLMAKMVARAG